MGRRRLPRRPMRPRCARCLVLARRRSGPGGDFDLLPHELGFQISRCRRPDYPRSGVRGKEDRALPFVEKIDKGGNATVYRAVVRTGYRGRAEGPRREAQRRAISSVQAGDRDPRRIGEFPGVLPVLDALSPRSLEGDPAWLAMPIARPIREVLADADLEQIVEAVAAVADTLARLQEEHAWSPRRQADEPLRADGDWLIGDFGLVDVPEGEDLTAAGKPVGSATTRLGR